MLITLPNEHLRQKSQKVGIVTPQILQVIEDMKAATLRWERSREHEVGVALAAIQIDHPYKIVVIRNNYDNKEDTSFTTFINPEVTKFEGTLEADFEGCLSVKDIYGKVPRYTKVRIKARDERGRQFRVTAEGFLARIFQHEIDHTNGVLFIDHIRQDPGAFYRLIEDGSLVQLDYAQHIEHSDSLWA